MNPPSAWPAAPPDYAAYGMNATEDTLGFLLALNLGLADKEAK
jgi:hypothetical protein